MKKIYLFLAMQALIITSVLSQEPAITMKIDPSYGSTIKFLLKTNIDNTIVKVDFGNDSLIEIMVHKPYTTISGIIGSSNTVKVYGEGITYLNLASFNLSGLDVSRDTTLTYLNCYGCQLNVLDISKNIALKELYFSYTPLSVLDISKNIALDWLNCSYNSLRSLDVSKNIALIGLECEVNELSELELTNNAQLKYLACYMNQLDSLNLTHNTALITVHCGNNRLRTLDVNKSTGLTSLIVHHNLIDSIDVSKNPALQELDCYSNLLNSLDISNNIALINLSCSDNQLTKLLVNNNPALQNIQCENNRLTSLEISPDTTLVEISCQNNLFTFATLPFKQSIYRYTPQAHISITKSIGIGAELDLSSQFSINGNITSYTWKTQSGTPLVEDTDYTINYGNTVFLKPQTDSVYCEMTNTLFPDFKDNNVLKTTSIKVEVSAAILNLFNDGYNIFSYNRIIYINSPKNVQMSIYDTDGRMIISKFIGSGLSSISITSTGIYLVKLSNNDRVVTKKIFVQ